MKHSNFGFVSRFEFRASDFLLFLFLLTSSGCAFLVRSSAFPIPPTLTLPLQDEGGGKGRGAPFRGAYHVHTEFSHDSKASLEKVIRTARNAGLDFVVVTDHNTREGAGAYRGQVPGEPLLIFGEEISSPDGHVIALGTEEISREGKTSQQIIDEIRQKGGYAVLAHPICRKNPWRNWEVSGYDGLEIYNFTHAFYFENKFKLAAKAGMLAPGPFYKWFEKTPHEALALWDRHLMEGRKVSAFAAADAHVHWQWLGITPENYMLFFQAVTMYAEAEALKEEAIIESLVKGRSYFAFEVRGGAQDFSFTAGTGSQNYSIGSNFRSETPMQFSVKTPAEAEIRLIHQGEVIASSEGRELSHTAQAPGAYRVEAYRRGKLWIVSNPIYVEK